MMGTRTSAPTSMKAWLECGAAACQMVTRPGITSGQIEMASPARVRPNMASAAAKGSQSRPRLIPCQAASAAPPNRKGMSAVTARPGHWNQRS